MDGKDLTEDLSEEDKKSVAKIIQAYIAGRIKDPVLAG